MHITNHSIQRILLTGLLSILPVGAARADIENTSLSRAISAETTAFSSDNQTSYTASQMDGTTLLGAFTRSYLQGASLSLVQTQSTLSHNSTVSLSTDEVLIDGTLRAIVSQNNERDEDLAAGSADLAQTTNLRFIFDLTEDANFTLTAMTTRLIQFVSYASYLTFSGDAPGFATIIAGDSLNGASGPNSLNLSGTLAPGRYDLSVLVEDSWNDHEAPSAHSDDRRVDFSFHATTVPEPSSALLLLSGTLLFLRRRPLRKIDRNA